MQKKAYDRAIDLAADPLTIINRVKDGSVTPEEVGHLKQMYPEVHGALSKQIMKKIGEQQLNEEMPTHKMRQGLSLFLGSPVESSFTQPSIMAAQSVYQAQALKSAQAAVAQNKRPKNTSKMGEFSKQFQTADQAAANRQSSEKIR